MFWDVEGSELNRYDDEERSCSLPLEIQDDGSGDNKSPTTWLRVGRRRRRKVIKNSGTSESSTVRI